ncbi:MAG: DUF309 domain-containing protein [Bacteriovoracaceae bacterium]|nr:DUF309 domain-containing protein [Bacteriovoracaceae bacterium]
MSQFQKEHLEKIREALILFNDQKYWECHEVLEDFWMEDKTDPIHYLYWVIIQVAASMIHYREKNLIGAHSMIMKAQEKIKKIEEHHLESEFLNRSLDYNHFKKMVLAVPKECGLNDFESLFNFRFPSI